MHLQKQIGIIFAYKDKFKILVVKSATGSIISYTNSSVNTSELVRIPITTTGNCQICLYQYGSIVNPIEHIALARSIT